MSSATPAPAFHLDDMECALDGLSTPSASAYAAAQALSQADSDPEQIMLSLRGLPVFPNPPSEADASQTPEAAFVVAGGPTCLVREVLLAPYPHPEAPNQLYATIDWARAAQNVSDFKPALRALRTVLLVWKKKHLWSILRARPDMTLSEGLQEEVRRAEERHERAIYRAAERERRDEEEREFARKMAEQGGEESAPEPEPEKPTPPAAQQRAGGADSDEEEEDDWEDDPPEWDDMSEEERQDHRRMRKKKTAEQVQEEVHVEVHKHEQPEEVLEFPSVTPEEELEFLTFYYNALGSVYQSAGAAVICSGQVPGHNAPGIDGVRWGRMRVVPCPAHDPAISVLLQGLTGNSFAATAITQPAYAANLATSVLEEDDADETEEDYIASSPYDISNSSDSRALIALWQAKRAHDLYVDLREGEKSRAIQEQRERDAAAKGKQAHGDDDDGDELSAAGDSANGGHSSLNVHTTLGVAGFASINIPNLSLAQLQSESKALGLFGFPHIMNLAGVGGPAQKETMAQVALGGGATLQTQSDREREANRIFWSTQPIVLPPGANGGLHQKHPTDSQKSLGMTQQFHDRQAALLHQATAGQAQTGAAQKLINPYAMCSSGDAATYSNLGATLFHLGNFPLALRCFFVALQIRLATIRPTEDEYIDVATSLNNLGVVLSQLKYYQPAWEYFSAAHELARGRLDPVHPRLNLIANNLGKIRPRRQAILNAPGILSQLRHIAETKELKEHVAREKRNAKTAKKGAKGDGAGAKATARKTTTARPGKKGEEVPKEFHEDTRFFRPPVDGQPPVVPPRAAEGAPVQPLGSAAAAIKTMPLRQFDVQMSEFGRLMLEFGPAKKKASAGGAAGKKKSKKK